MASGRYAGISLGEAIYRTTQEWGEDNQITVDEYNTDEVNRRGANLFRWCTREDGSIKHEFILKE